MVSIHASDAESMNILQIHNYYSQFGGECAVVNAENSLLRRRGHNVIQFARKNTCIERLPLRSKIQILFGIPNNRATAKKLLTLTRHFPIDVAHVHNVFPLFSPTVYSVLKQVGIPVVQSHHNFRVVCPNGLFYTNRQICTLCSSSFLHAINNKCVRNNRLLSLFYALAIYFAWRKESFKKDITIHLSLNRFFAQHLVNAGIDKDRIRICANFMENHSKRMNHKQAYFLYIGRLSKEKGLDTLVRAVQKSKVNLKIAGTGPDEQLLKDYVLKHGMYNVEFMGFVTGNQKRNLIEKSLSTLIPSEWFENFPISAVESMAMGTPVIASRIGGLPEVVEDGKTGLLFEPGNVDDLAGKLSKIWHNPELAQEMGAQAKVHAQNRFSPEAHYQNLMAIYNEAIDRHQDISPHRA